jgi:hypothetical protein
MTAPTITITLPADAFNRYLNTVETLPGIIGQAEEVFAFLNRLHEDKDHDGHLGFAAITGLCARALASVGDVEGLNLEHLAEDMRKASKGRDHGK